jgi:hypothetical protein
MSVATVTNSTPVDPATAGPNLATLIAAVLTISRLLLPMVGGLEIFVAYWMAGLPPSLATVRPLGVSSSRVTESIYLHVTGKDLRGGSEVMERMVT